jgi:hypothetical protein
MFHLSPVRVALVVSVLLAGSAARGQQADPLAAGFAAPPEAAKPQTWWHWVNGNVSKAGITLDLEAMKRVGLGGAHLAQVGPGVPQGPVPYDSPQMAECVRFAFQEADRLGLELCLFNSPGWSSTGGPWIKPENSMKVLVYTETTAAGGQNVSVLLAQPRVAQGFYRDAYVVAYPTPAEDARVPNFNNGGGAGRGAGRGGAATASAPAAGAGGNAAVGTIDPTKVVDLTKNMNAQGQLTWNAPAGNWTILRIGFTTNGTQNRPAPDGGGGLEVDKYSKEALDFHFNYFFGPLYDVMKPLAARGQVAALIDSYETGPQNWTDRFPAEFQKRRGYDMMAYMPTMMLGRIVGSTDMAQRFLWDVRKTQAELMDEYYYGHFTELCHQHGMLAYTEPYNTVNFDEMIAGSYADMPMGEFWQGAANERSIKLVASVMHMNGKPIMGAESFTSQSRWTEYPYALKALGDFMWTQGLNKFVFHRFAMQPNPDPTAVPGMTMGPWGGHFDRTNTWFEQGRAWMQYIQRSQFLLQQGQFVGDLVYFAGEDSPVRNPDESRLNPPPPPGHDFDTIDTGTMQKRVKIVDGKITLPDGLAYRVFVLPAISRTMSVQTAQNLHDLVNAGMTLVVNGPKPERTPSLMDYPNGDAKVARLAGDLWGNLDGTTVTEVRLGQGRVFWGVPLASVLEEKLNAKADFTFTSHSGTADVNYIHRHVPASSGGAETEIYFVANRGQQAEDLVCSFNVTGKQPELWDAVSGQHGRAGLYNASGGRTSIPLQFEPSGSMFVVFRNAPAAHLTSISRDAKPLVSADPLIDNTRPPPAGLFPRTNQRALALPQPPEPRLVELAAGAAPVAWQSGAYTLRNAQGRDQSIAVTVPAPLEVTGPWHVAFPPRLGVPPQEDFDWLISWPDSRDVNIKYFSGTATYTHKITVPMDSLTYPRRVFLDLGRVQVLAQVLLNGKDLGIVWTFPYRVDITDAAHGGDNDLEIRVTNLWPNRLIGDEQLPAEIQYVGAGGRGAGGAGAGRGLTNSITQIPDWYAQGLAKPAGQRITFTTWHHWSATDPLIESGLIGPVMLRTAVPLALP